MIGYLTSFLLGIFSLYQQWEIVSRQKTLSDDLFLKVFNDLQGKAGTGQEETVVHQSTDLIITSLVRLYIL